MGCVALVDSACVSILFSPQSPQGVYSTLCMTRGLREEMLVPSERELQFLTTRYLVVGMRDVPIFRFYFTNQHFYHLYYLNTDFSIPYSHLVT